MNFEQRLALIFNRIHTTTVYHENKTQVELALKTCEEVGELAQAVLSHNGVPGCKYKKLGREEITEEAADAFLCVLATLLRMDREGGLDDASVLPGFLDMVEKKIDKWQWALQQDDR